MNYVHIKCPTIASGEQSVAIPVKHLDHGIFLGVFFWDTTKEEWHTDRHVAWILDVVPGAFVPYAIGKWR